MIDFFQNNFEFIIFILLLTLFLIWKRKNLEVQGKFPFFYILMYKTSLGIKFMKSLSKKHPRLILGFSYVSYFIGILLVFLSFVFMIWQLFFIYENEYEVGGAFVLPIKTESGIHGDLPIFYVPFFEWIIALIVIAIVHEFAHGVVSKRFNIKIKSSGFAFLGIFAPILPAAFVEPDEKQIKKASFFEKVSVYGAGSTSNFLFGIVFLLLFLLIGLGMSKIAHNEEFKFNSVLEKSELNNYNITNGKLLEVNGDNETKNFLKILSSSNSSLTLKIESLDKTQEYNISTYFDEKLNRNMIGISDIEIIQDPKEGFETLYLVLKKTLNIFFWIWFLNIMIGFANLLPLAITDGGQIFREICFKYFSENIAKNLYFYVSIFTILLLILTIFPKLLFIIF